MEITLTLNGKKLTRMVEADTVLLDFLRKEGCYSVKRGCDTTTAVCALYLWMISRCFPVLFWQRVPQATAS